MPNITLEPDMCACNIDFEVGEYARMVTTDLPDYTGATTVTPSKQTQTLETENTAVHSDITVEAIPYEDVEAATPSITVDGQGKVTATTTQAGGIVESATKTAEYQQPIVARAKPTVSVDNTGKITATTSQAGGFVQGGTETTELQQKIVEQATLSITVDNTGKITASATQTAGFVSAGTKSATLQQTPVEQATPSISVAANGTVTASATQTGGFVVSGTKSATYSLPTQAAKTVIPTESAQTAVTAGKWTTGAVQVGAIPSDYFKPSGTLPITSNGTYDVKSYASANVSVPGIVPSGTLSIGANGDYDVASYASASVNVPGIETELLTVTENGVYTASSGHAYTPVTVNVAGGGGISYDDIANRSLSGVASGNASVVGKHAFTGTQINAAIFPNAQYVGSYAFDTCSVLSYVSFESATLIEASAFFNCYMLEEVSCPALITVEANAFKQCARLKNVSFPSARSIGQSAFYACSSLAYASFASASYFGNQAFRSCLNLVSLHLDGIPSVPYLGTSVFTSTPIGGYSAKAGQYGSVFVPASLYESFLTASGWSSISSRIVSV